MDYRPQAPLSLRFPRKEYWSGQPIPSPEDLPNPGIEPASPALQADSLPLSHQGSPILPLGLFLKERFSWWHSELLALYVFNLKCQRTVNKRILLNLVCVNVCVCVCTFTCVMVCAIWKSFFVEKTLLFSFTCSISWESLLYYEFWSPVCNPYSMLTACSVTSVMSDFCNHWTVVHQDALSMGFSRQDYWSGLPCSCPRYLPNPGIENASPTL